MISWGLLCCTCIATMSSLTGMPCCNIASIQSSTRASWRTWRPSCGLVFFWFGDLNAEAWLAKELFMVSRGYRAWVWSISVPSVPVPRRDGLLTRSVKPFLVVVSSRWAQSVITRPWGCAQVQVISPSSPFLRKRKVSRAIEVLMSACNMYFHVHEKATTESSAEEKRSLRCIKALPVHSIEYLESLLFYDLVSTYREQTHRCLSHWSIAWVLAAAAAVAANARELPPSDVVKPGWATRRQNRVEVVWLIGVILYYA